MNLKQNTIPLKELLLSLFHQNVQDLEGKASLKLNTLRHQALKEFERQGFPTSRLESWRFTDISEILSQNYTFDFRNNSRPFDLKEIFTCEVYDLDTYILTLLNGWFVYQQTPLYKFDNGVIIGSLARAMEEFPEIVEKYLGSASTTPIGSFTALNTAFMQDGLFVYVPRGVTLEKPIQLVNIVNSQVPLFLQPRSLVIAEAGSSLTLVHCDHALTHTPAVTNTVLEVFLQPDARVDHYKVQNKGKSSALFTSTYFQLQEGSKVSSCIMTLNGGFTRNSVEINLLGPQSQANLKGLYLADRGQFVDNQVLINHAAPGCFSNQLFKGILDDQAKAVFSGRIKVQRDAQQTQAYQKNKNLLLTDEARVNSQPHLEIYADDVKCSHGATIGQLEPNAMFYLRSRGISEKTARQLMMLAFADEIVKEISIEPLKQKIGAMVEKRLKGELSICDQCVLHCKDNSPAVFNIDLTKI